MVDEKSESQSDETIATEKSEETQFSDADYKKLQTDNEKLSGERDEAVDNLELVTPFVDYGKMGGGNESGGDDTEADPDAPKKDPEVAQLKRRIAINEEIGRFRTENPDLVMHEKIVTNFLLQQNPNQSMSKRMDKAVKATKEHLNTIRKEGADSAIASKKKKDDEEALAAGLGSTGSTSPDKADDEGESTDDYIKTRQKRSRRLRGVPDVK